MQSKNVFSISQPLKTYFMKLLSISCFSILLLLSCGKSSAELEAEREERLEFIEHIEDSIRTHYQYALERIIDSATMRKDEDARFAAMYAKLFHMDVQREFLADSIGNMEFRRSKYNLAVLGFSEAIKEGFNLSETYFKRAECFIKLKETQLAVNDLKASIKLGNQKASELHDKINPELKKFVGYTTRCCDGTESHSSGRGACSHHGGVCNEYEPVYKTYRKYE